MVSCVVRHCGNSEYLRKIDPTKKHLRFFPIPKLKATCELTAKRFKKRQDLWLQAINRPDITVEMIQKGRCKVCSDHFKSGSPSNKFLEDSEDWIPTKNLHPIPVPVQAADEKETNGTVDWLPSLNLGSSDEAESSDLSTCGADCQSPSQEFPSTPPRLVLQPSNLISLSGSCDSAPSNPLLKPRRQNSSERRVGSVSILKGRPLSVSSTDSHSSLSSTSKPSILELSPTKVTRLRSPNTKCYRRRDRKREIPECEQSSDFDKSKDVSAELNASSCLDSAIANTSQDALAEEVCLQKNKIQDLQDSLLDYKRRYKEQCANSRKLRDRLTEVEVDKLEMQAKLKSADVAMILMRSVVDTMEEDFKRKKEEEICEINRKHEELMAKRDKELEKIKREARNADALTFMKLEVFSSNDALVKFYTGIASYDTFNLTLELVLKHGFKDKAHYKCALAPWQSMLMTLMRMRLGLLLQDLAFRFGVSVSTVGSSTDEWRDAFKTFIQTLPNDSTLGAGIRQLFTKSNLKLSRKKPIGDSETYSKKKNAATIQ